MLLKAFGIIVVGVFLYAVLVLGLADLFGMEADTAGGILVLMLMGLGIWYATWDSSRKNR
jgi:hypothetical protein